MPTVLRVFGLSPVATELKYNICNIVANKKVFIFTTLSIPLPGIRLIIFILFPDFPIFSDPVTYKKQTIFPLTTTNESAKQPT